MIDQAAILTAIRAHGAARVYAMANAAFGNRSILDAVGLSAETMADVSAVQIEAYRQLGDADKAIDYAQAAAKLSSFPVEP